MPVVMKSSEKIMHLLIFSNLVLISQGKYMAVISTCFVYGLLQYPQSLLYVADLLVCIINKITDISYDI